MFQEVGSNFLKRYKAKSWLFKPRKPHTYKQNDKQNQDSTHRFRCLYFTNFYESFKSFFSTRETAHLQQLQNPGPTGSDSILSTR